MSQPIADQDASARLDTPEIVQHRVRVGRKPLHNPETQIRLDKNGTTIEAIHITCGCGEEIVVKCLYTDGNQ